MRRQGEGSASLAFRRRRPVFVPGADLLADVAPEDPVANQGTGLLRHFAPMLDRPVADAPGGVQDMGGRQRTRRAGVEAAPAVAAKVLGERLGRFEFQGEEQLSEQEPRSGAIEQLGVLGRWRQAPPAPPVLSPAPVRCRRRGARRSPGTPPGYGRPGPAGVAPSAGGSHRRGRTGPPGARDRLPVRARPPGGGSEAPRTARTSHRRAARPAPVSAAAACPARPWRQTGRAPTGAGTTLRRVRTVPVKPPPRGRSRPPKPTWSADPRGPSPTPTPHSRPGFRLQEDLEASGVIVVRTGGNVL